MELKINAAGIAAQFKEMEMEVQQDIELAVQELAKMTHQRISDQIANGPNKLGSSLTVYQENLSKPELSSPGVWVVSLGEDALWIEDGSKAHDMKPDLLKGAKFRVIPFDQNKRPQNRTSNDNDIMADLKTGLKEINNARKQSGQSKINLTKIEKDSNGNPRLGKLHELELPSRLPTANAKNPALKGLTIYQSKDEKTGNVRRDVLTFRTVSVNSDPASWMQPAHEGKKFFDEAYTWALGEWETKILPEILKKYGG